MAVDKYTLAPYFSCGFYKDELDLGFGSILLTIVDKEQQRVYLKAAAFMQEPRTLDELKHFIFSNATSHQRDIYENFISNNFLMNINDLDFDDRYSRSYLYYNLSGADPKNIQAKLQQKHVVILGCGGIGNIISVNLATAGVGQLTLVDDDHIELSNLTRQIMFNEHDVGKNKTDVLKQALVNRNHNVHIETINVRCDTFEKMLTLPASDLIVASGDSAHICAYLNQYAHRTNIPFLNVCYIQDIACWGPFIIPGKTPCYDCFSHTNIADNEKDNDNEMAQLVKAINQSYKAPSFGPVNMLSASLATLDVVKFLADFGTIQSLNRRVGVWTHDLKIEYQHYHQNPNCTCCAI